MSKTALGPCLWRTARCHEVCENHTVSEDVARTTTHAHRLLRELAESGLDACGHAMTTKLKAIALMASKLQDVLAVVLLVRHTNDRQTWRRTTFAAAARRL